MKKIWRKSATAEIFASVNLGDWIESVGMVTTHFEVDFIRRYGEWLLDAARRDRLRIGITQKHSFDSREGDISNLAWRLAVKQGAKEAERERKSGR